MNKDFQSINRTLEFQISRIEEFEKELEALKKEPFSYYKDATPKNIFTEFAKNLTDINFSECNKNISFEIIDSHNILLGRDFSVTHIPQLINKISENEDLTLFLENLSLKYEKRSTEINTMLSSPLWEKKDEITQSARKIWSQRAFFLFSLSLAFRGKDVFHSSLEKKNAQHLYLQHLEKINPKTDPSFLSPEFLEITQKLEFAQKKNDSLLKIGALTSEFLEFYVQDEKNLSPDDFNHFKKGLIFVIDSIPRRNIKKKDKEKILEEIASYCFEKNNFTDHLDFLKKIDLLLKKYSQKELKKEFQKELKISENLFQEKARRSLETELEDTLFYHAEKKIWEESDAQEIVKKNFSDKMFFEVMKYSLQKETSPEWKSLKKAQKEYKKIKEKGSPQEIAQVQIKIANTLNLLVYSQRFWDYHEDGFTLRDIFKKRINCMAQSALLHILFRELFDIETKGAMTRRHYFSVLPLADGRMLQLDGNVPEIISLKNDDSIQRDKSFLYLNTAKEDWVQIGNHQKMYKAFVWHSMSNDTQKNPHKKVYFAKKAAETLPNNPITLNTFAVSLMEEDPYKNESEIKFALRKAIALAPYDLSFSYNLGYFYNKTKQKEKAFKIFSEMVEKFPKNSDAYVYLGTYYDRMQHYYEKAKDAYEMAEEVKRNDLSSFTKYSLDEIISLRNELERKKELKKKIRKYISK